MACMDGCAIVGGELGIGVASLKATVHPMKIATMACSRMMDRLTNATVQGRVQHVNDVTAIEVGNLGPLPSCQAY
jgi:hypothetical protein